MIRTTINDTIRDGELYYHINREAAKISMLFSGRVHKYVYLSGEEIFPSNKSKVAKQAKFTYSPLTKGLKKQTKTTKDQEGIQVGALKTLKHANQQLTVKDAVRRIN